MAAAPFVPILISSRYQLLDKLGVGNMGTVYRAKDRLTDQTVALKQVLARARHAQPTPTTGSVALAQEFKFLASLRHPHIISVLDYGFDTHGQPFYTMTLLEDAQELAATAAKRDLAGKIALILQVLQALVYLHRRGILHRDLKPANVLVDAEGAVKVVDFGLAVAADQENAPAGTLVYMAPEVLRGQSAVVQSDLYAVGVMAYELFAGRRPFDAPHPIALMYKITHEALNVEPLKAIDPALTAILQKLLTAPPDDRYASAEAVIKAFAEATGQPYLLETRATRESFLQAAQFVGRDAELNLLNRALVEAADGKGGVWLIGGESGVGKSRLLDELHTQALLRGALALRGQAVAEGGTPYQLWRDAIRRLSLQTDLTDFEATVLKLLVPDIDRLLGRAVGELPLIDAQSLQIRLLSVIESMFRQQRQLIVLLLEDLQWADDSLVLLKRLNGVANQTPLLIIGTYRIDDRPSLPDELPMLHHLKLDRLPPASIEALSVSMLGETGKSPPVIDLLKRETEGNIFFIVEVVRTLAEEAGGLADIGNKTLPAHVFAGGMQTVIRRRLDKVPESARQMLTIAAVAGREVDPAMLRQAMPTVAIDDWLQQVATVIEVQDDRYRFAHDKLREGILTVLAADERRTLHATVAQAIEAAYPDSPEQYAALAYHWGQAQHAAKTVQNATLAGEQSLRSGSYREAIQFFSQALALTDQVSLDTRQVSNLYHLLGEAYWGQSDMPNAREWHTKALELLGYAVPAQSGQLARGTLKPLLRHVGRRLVGTQRVAADPEALIVAAKSFHQILQVSYHEANFRLGLYSIFNGMDAVERTGENDQAAWLRVRYYSTLGYATADAALHPIARSYFNLAQRRLNGVTDPETPAWFGLLFGMYQAGLGQLEQASARLETAARVSKAAGGLRLFIQTSEVRAPVYCLQGRFAEALDVVEAALQIAIRDGHSQSIGRFRVAKARILLLQGKTADARTYYFDHAPEIEESLRFGTQAISKMMLSGLLVELHSRAEEWDLALQSAATLNRQMRQAQTLSFILTDEAAASIALYLTLWEKQRQASPSLRSGEGDRGGEVNAYRQQALTSLNFYHRKYTRHYPIGRPLESTLRCWYHRLNGDEKQAHAAGAQAIQSAQQYQMPGYEAAARDHLARVTEQL